MQHSTAQHSTAQHSTAQHSSPCEKLRKPFWTKLKVKTQRQRQWTKHFPVHAEGQRTEGPIPRQEGNTALSVGRALASKCSQCHGSKVFGLVTAMFWLLTAMADVSCVLDRCQFSKGNTAKSSCICRFQDSFTLPKGSQCPSERRPKGS